MFWSHNTFSKVLSIQSLNKTLRSQISFRLELETSVYVFLNDVYCHVNFTENSKERTKKNKTIDLMAEQTRVVTFL